MSTQDFRDFILNCSVPSIIKNLNLSWQFFDHSFLEFSEIFDSENENKKLIFDQGLQRSSGIQFENDRLKKPLTVKEFLEVADSDVENWYCYNYKYIKDLPRKFRDWLNFRELGFDEAEDDVSFWLGSKNSHTPCHQDAYGINIVVQVYGKKSWLLFPPTAKIQPSRVPFEESSIYSQENFYSPRSYRDFLELENEAYQVTLEPGDILIVPRKWWHFVKVVETSLNFNWWIKLVSF
jgi:HSPB1-associated protein 1